MATKKKAAKVAEIQRGKGLPGKDQYRCGHDYPNGTNADFVFTFECERCRIFELAFDKKEVTGGAVTTKNLHELFQYWGSPVVDKITTNGHTEQYQALRKSAYEFAKAILAQVPPGEGQQNALQLVRGSVHLGAVGISEGATENKRTESDDQ